MDQNLLPGEFRRMQKLAGVKYDKDADEIIKAINEAYLLNEGWWESAKYTLSKLGRYKAGGKIFGKGKVDAESAAKMKELLNKKGNELINQLDDLIKSKTKEFPNNKSQEEFLDVVLEIAKVYDSVLEAAKLNSKDEKFLPVDAANAVIEDLREYVKDYLDTKLAAVYSVTNEAKEEDTRTKEEKKADLKAKKEKFKEKTKDTKEKIKSGEEEAYSSERLKTLKSWKLPLALLGAGASFGALGWLIKLISSDAKEVTYTIAKEGAEKLGDIKPGEGFTQILNRTMDAGLSPSSSPEDLIAQLKEIGNGDALKGVAEVTQQGGVFSNPDAAKETLTAIVNDPRAHGDNLGEILKGTWAGTGKAAGDTLVTVPGGTLSKLIMQAVVKTAVVNTTKYALAGPILKTLGVGLFAGGVAVALARWKGRKSSRAQVLNDLYQNLRPLKPSEKNPTVVGSKPEDKKDNIARLSTSDGGETPTTVASSPEQTKKNVATFSSLNRNGQIATVLSKINPKLDISKALGKDSISNYSDKELVGYQTSEEASAEAKKLSSLIINLRKSPDSLLKKVEKALGVKFEKRAKAISTKPGAETKAQLQTVSENNSLHSLLNEAMIDQVFTDLGIDDESIKANKVEILALLGSMYASEGDNKLSIVDLEKLNLNDKEKEELKNLGFSPQAGGNYVFLGKGQTKKDVVPSKDQTPATTEKPAATPVSHDKLQNKNKTQSDVAGLNKTLKSKTGLHAKLKRINNVDEFRDLVLSILDQTDPRFSSDKQKVTSTLFSLRNRIQEIDTKDTSEAIKSIMSDSSMKNLLKKINNTEEAIQLILRDIIPYLEPNFIKDKTKLKNSIIGAINRYKSLPSDKPLE